MANQKAGGEGPQATAEEIQPVVRYVHHVSFRVDDLDEALEFYCGLLGFERCDRPEMDFPGAWLRLYDVQVHLLQLPVDAGTGTPPAAPVGRANHVAFSVDDLEDMRAHLERAGLEVGSGDPALPQFFVQDPSGNVVEFTAFAR